MRMNREGIVALMDSMIFIMVMMIATAAFIGYMDSTSDDDGDVSGFLEDLLYSEVRMNDMTEGDGSLIRVSDMMALWMKDGGEEFEEYLTEILDSFSHGRPYLMVMIFTTDNGRLESSIGGMESSTYRESEITVPVTTGGKLTVRFALSS